MTETRKPTAKERRFEAMCELANRYNGPEGHEYEITETRRDVLAAEIRKLAGMSRTQRWQDAIERWAALVEDESNEVKWAWTQGSMFPVWADN